MREMRVDISGFRWGYIYRERDRGEGWRVDLSRHDYLVFRLEKYCIISYNGRKKKTYPFLFLIVF